MANNERLDEVLVKIEGDLEHWNQDSYGHFIDRNEVAKSVGLEYFSWINVTDEIVAAVEEKWNACDTAFCFAGHAVLEYTDSKPSVRDLMFGWTYVDQKDPNSGTVHLKAKEVLGLTGDQAEVLFDGNNSLETLRGLVEAIKDNEFIDYDELDNIRREIQPELYDDDEDYYDEDEDYDEDDE